MAHILNFKEALSWQDFQLFCTDLLKSDNRFADARDFLKQGSTQDGIDVYAIPHNDVQISVAQCKLENYISPKEISDIVDVFLKGNFVDNAKEFILCTSFDFKTAKVEDAISKAREKLKLIGIEFIVWDKSGLESELRVKPRPQLIARYFGEKIALEFYGNEYEDWIRQYRKIKKQSYLSNPNYIKRTLTPYIEIKERRDQFFLYNGKNATLPEVYSQPLGEKGKRVVMLSTAGFGKSWEVENLASYYSDESKLLFPIKNRLIDYEGQTVETLLNQYHGWKDVPEDALLIIFDGLDEIKSNNIQTFINHLNQFVESHPKSNILISSRYNFYDISYPPLRNFELYILDEFTSDDIDEYIISNLDIQHQRFLKKVQDNGFLEYLRNPYYLSRFVRFYKDTIQEFPKNKAALFDRILFEDFDSDNSKYNAEIRRSDFQEISEKVAFCMTLLGKSNLNEDEIQIIIPDKKVLEDFKKFFLFTKSETDQKSWSFEHKNLQEYLCASFFQRLPFTFIRQIVSLPHFENRLQPWFLNTISFLFSSSKEELFEPLFLWLRDSQPELLIRFEKDLINKEARIEILNRIMAYYEEKNLSLFNSSNFNIQELATFIEIDTQVIDILEQKLLDHKTSDWMAYDIIRLLSECPNPYVYKARITNILLSAVTSKRYFNYFASRCIRALIDLRFLEKETAEALLNSRIDLTDFEIRSAMVSYINHAELTEDYCDFVLASREIYYEGQKGKTPTMGPNETLVAIIASFKMSDNIKKVLRMAISDPDLISERHSFSKAHLRIDKTEKLLLNAQEAYKQDKAILPLVYRIFVSNGTLAFNQVFGKMFKAFFESTCGLFCIFSKFYKYSSVNRNFMLFVDVAGSDMLLNEFRSGKIPEPLMKQYRNRMSWENRDLFLKFQDTLEKEYGEAFVIKDLNIDFGKLKQEYVQKNQQMLLNRDTFFLEAQLIFKEIGKNEITITDLWSSEDLDLRKFQDSVVLQTLHRRVSDIAKNQEQLLGNLKDEKRWDWFRVKYVEKLLCNNQKEELIPELRTFAKKWCLDNVRTFNYSNTVRDTSPSSITFDKYVDFNNKLFCLLDLDAEDELLLKMLQSDYSGNLDNEELNLSSLIIKKVHNKDLLKKTVLKNIKVGLPSWVLKTHFAICHQLVYKECLEDLYSTIINYKQSISSDRSTLTDYYIDLGGKLEDFNDYIVTPNEEYYSSWTWHLIERAKESNPVIAIPILIDIITSSTQSENNRVYASKLLIQLQRIEGLRYWRDYIIKQRVTPFDHNQDVIIQHAPEMELGEVLAILKEILEFTYNNNLHNTLKFPDSIEDAIYAILHSVALKDYAHFIGVNDLLQSNYSKYETYDFARNIIWHQERISQNFYKNQTQQLSLDDVLEKYETFKMQKEKVAVEAPKRWFERNRESIIAGIIAFAVLILSIIAHLNGLL